MSDNKHSTQQAGAGQNSAALPPDPPAADNERSDGWWCGLQSTLYSWRWQIGATITALGLIALIGAASKEMRRIESTAASRPLPPQHPLNQS